MLPVQSKIRNDPSGSDRTKSPDRSGILTPMPLFRPDDIKLETGVEDTVFGKYRARMFRNAGGLTQFGAFIEVLMPGSYSSKLHWHSSEDEMIHVPAGSVTLIEGDNLEILRPGRHRMFSGRHSGRALFTQSYRCQR